MRLRSIDKPELQHFLQPPVCGRSNRNQGSLKDGSQSRGYWNSISQSPRRVANRVAVQPEKFGPRVWRELATSRLNRPGSSQEARKFQQRFRETLSAIAIFANEARRGRCRSSERSMEQICAADGANKNRAVAVDGLFRQIAQQIRALQPHQKSRAERGCRRLPIKGIQRGMRPMATNRATQSGRHAALRRPVGAARRPCHAIETARFQVAETRKQSGTLSALRW